MGSTAEGRSKFRKKAISPAANIAARRLLTSRAKRQVATDTASTYSASKSRSGHPASPPMAAYSHAASGGLSYHRSR